jgi:hypothetical protein
MLRSLALFEVALLELEKRKDPSPAAEPRPLLSRPVGLPTGRHSD